MAQNRHKRPREAEPQYQDAHAALHATDECVFKESREPRALSRPVRDVYPVHVMTRNSFGLMTRKLSVTESQRSTQFRGTFSRKKLSVASANWAHVA